MVLKTLSTYPPRLIFRIFKFLLQRPKKLKKSTKRAAKSDFFRRFNCCEPCPDNISDKTYDKWLFILYLIFFDFSRVLNDFFACNIDGACFQKRMFSFSLIHFQINTFVKIGNIQQTISETRSKCFWSLSLKRQEPYSYWILEFLENLPYLKNSFLGTIW